MLFYNYWENFTAQWNSGKKAIGSWTDPDALPLCNDSFAKDLSSDYIPEPWWGNDGTQPLHSVVINYNPGKGYGLQKKGTIAYKSSYAQDVVNPPALPKTQDWHWIKRAKPVLESLSRLGFISGTFGIENHLSIEMIPWHTDKAGDGFKRYVDANILNIYECSLCFAAHESKRIENDKLRSKVILRMNDKTALDYLQRLEELGLGYYFNAQPTKPTTSGNGKFMEFTINKLPGTKFICIWGPRSRNDFPPKADMDEILSKI